MNHHHDRATHEVRGLGGDQHVVETGGILRAEQVEAAGLKDCHPGGQPLPRRC